MPANPTRKVTVIPADVQMTEKDIRKQILRVAPYCRVSTSSKEQLESYDFLQLAAAVGAGSTQYDEMLKQISMEFSSLVAKRTELEKAKETASCANERATQIAAELGSTEPGITEFDEIAVRQLIDSIKVMGKDKLLIRFKDGMELEQPITTLR